MAPSTGWTDSLSPFDLSDLDTVKVEERAQPFLPTTIMDAYFEIKDMASSLTPRVGTAHEEFAYSGYADDEHKLEGLHHELISDSETFSETEESFVERGRRDSSDENSFVEETAKFWVDIEALSDSRCSEDHESLYSNDSEFYEDESSEEDCGFFTGLRRRDTVVADNLLSASSCNAWIQVNEPTHTPNDPPFFTNPWDSSAPSYLGPTPTTDPSVQSVHCCLVEEHVHFFALGEERAAAVRATEKIGPLDLDDSVRSDKVSSQSYSRLHRADLPREGEITMENLIRATLHYQEHFKENVTSANVITAIRNLHKHERRLRNAGRAIAPFNPFNEETF